MWNDCSGKKSGKYGFGSSVELAMLKLPKSLLTCFRGGSRVRWQWNLCDPSGLPKGRLNRRRLYSEWVRLFGTTAPSSVRWPLSKTCVMTFTNRSQSAARVQTRLKSMFIPLRCRARHANIRRPSARRISMHSAATSIWRTPWYIAVWRPMLTQEITQLGPFPATNHGVRPAPTLTHHPDPTPLINL